MTVNESLGVIYDTIFYTVTFFNKKFLVAHSPWMALGEPTWLFHYNSLRSSAPVPDPPDCLYPLFYYNLSRCCVTSAYLRNHFDYFSGTLDDFVSSVFLNKSKFKRFVMEYYFSDEFEVRDIQKLCVSDGETVLRAAEFLSKTIDIKYHADLFYHFNEMIDTALEYFVELIPFIKTYHANHRDETEETLKKFLSTDYQRLVKKSLIKCDADSYINLKSQVYAICYLNSSIVASYYINEKYIFILGIDWPLIISQALDYSHVTMHSVMNALGHSTKVDIVNELRKGDLTISQMARSLQLARTSVSRCVDDLLDELVIVKARKIGPEVYYRLNPTYLRHAKNTFDEFIDKAISDAAAQA